MSRLADQWPTIGRSRPVRRLLVVVGVAAWAVLVSPYPMSNRWAGGALVLLLAVIGMALGIGTGWEVLRRRAGLDEREAAARDRAYRAALRVVVAGVMLMILAAWFLGPQINQDLPTPPDGLGTYRVLALAALFLLAPTAVISWLRPSLLD